MTFDYQFIRSAPHRVELLINISNYIRDMDRFVKKLQNYINRKNIIVVKKITCEDQCHNTKFISGSFLHFIGDIFHIVRKFPESVHIDKNAIELTSFRENKDTLKLIVRLSELFNLKENADSHIAKEPFNQPRKYNRANISSHLPPLSYWNAEYELMKKGYRKVGKYECNSPKEAERLQSEISRYFPYTKIISRDQVHIDIYYSLKNQHLTEIINNDNILNSRSIKKTGNLFGYPICCTKEYIKDKFLYLPSFLFKWLVKRYKTDGEIHQLFNPFLSNLYYFPCNLRCPHTLSRLEIIQKHILKHQKEKLLFYPAIFFLSRTLDAPIYRGIRGQMDFVIVQPMNFEGNFLKYRPIYCFRKTTNTEIIFKGDSLHYENGIMTIFNNNRVIHKFFLEASIWYYKKTLDSHFTKLFIKTLKNFIQANPIPLNRNIMGEEFLKIKESLYNIEESLKLIKIKLADIKLNKNEIMVELIARNFNNSNVIFSIQKISDSLNFFIKGKRYVISIKKCDKSLPENLIRSLGIYLLNTIELNEIYL